MSATDIESIGNAGEPTEEDEAAELAQGKYLGSSFIRNVAKVINEEEAEKLRVKSPKEQRMLDQIDRTLLVMSQMQLYSRNCSIRFLKEPNRLELKYERSFTMAVKKNRQHLITKFPRYSVKAVYVSCS